MEKHCDNCKHYKNIDSINDRCQRCSAMSDIYNHYPMWEAKTAEKRTVTRVHMIADIDGIRFQNAINKFIADKKVIDIKLTSVWAIDDEVVSDRALIIYEEEV